MKEALRATLQSERISGTRHTRSCKDCLGRLPFTMTGLIVGRAPPGLIMSRGEALVGVSFGY